MEVEPSAPQHVQELWFEDGNLIIQAGTSRFRVHRGVLAARSPVFQDMLSFPQPPDAELVEGCPAVRLHDSATDVTVFLKVIFDSSFFMSYPSETDFDIIAGCLRLSHKYEVDYLRRRALVHFSSGYCTTLAATDASDSDVLTLEWISWNRQWMAPTPAMMVILLAREVDALWILPYAFHLLAASFKNGGMEIFHGGLYKGVPVNLSREDQQRFLRGYHLQQSATMTEIMGFMFDSFEIPGCCTPAICMEERLNAFRYFRETLALNPCIPLNTWDLDDWAVLERMCPTCLAVLKQKHQEARQVLWDKLPSMYGLPKWEELESLKVAAIGTNLVG
ncbi:hypothetical protein B0H17DRAFT_983461 [Mycena rosella]|uniref:BTB domain-containing protein n=1 Tax=Mycena rosella TaxID=1033263 RepID=A0AAD7DEL3_MYCRO|nr:hypothetical protein B0H17DRAFT_983461 [Mycena rosella]